METTANHKSMTQLLQAILESFPQADPASEFYGENISGSEAVDFLSQIIPEIRECLDAPVLKVAVILDGGLVQHLTCDRPEALPPITFMVIDYDTEGTEEEELVEVPQGDEENSTSNACVHLPMLGKAKIDLDAVLKQIEND